MTSFHKPKLYRSHDGCCICRAKSSSSRFTSSKKYEEHFPDCFKLSEVRAGEVCNACVLIVKRWKNLPDDTLKDWAHVVDARIGPGVKNVQRPKREDISKDKEEKCGEENRSNGKQSGAQSSSRHSGHSRISRHVLLDKEESLLWHYLHWPPQRGDVRSEILPEMLQSSKFPDCS